MLSLKWSPEAWSEYTDLQEHDQSIDINRFKLFFITRFLHFLYFSSVLISTISFIV
jgi:hypothetical protein